MFVVLYIAIIALFFGLLLLLTFGSNGWDFVSIDLTLAVLHNDFLIGLYVLLPAVYVFIFTVLSRNYDFATYNWLIALGIAVVRFIAIIAFSRWHIVPKIRWFLISVTSIAMAYLVCQAVLSSHASFSSFNANTVVLIMWFVSVLVIGKLLGGAKFGNIDEYTPYRDNIRRLYSKYQEQYKSEVAYSRLRNSTKYRLLFSIMIAEDLNRPGIIRILERALFSFSSIATTGIMQVSSKDYLSNQKSIVMAQEIIDESYKRHYKQTKEEYPLVRSITADYNGDAYPELVADIYYILKEYDLKIHPKK